MAQFGAAPDSPADTAQSPLPVGIQGDLELELTGLANALYNLGTTVINDSTKEKAPGRSGAHESAGKPVGQRVNDVIGHLATIEEMAASLHVPIPMQALQDVDNGRNPMISTKDRLERAATENQFMNGKIDAIKSYRKLLDASLKEHFPELAPYLDDDDGMKLANGSTSEPHVTIKSEALS